MAGKYSEWSWCKVILSKFLMPYHMYFNLFALKSLFHIYVSHIAFSESEYTDDMYVFDTLICY